MTKTQALRRIVLIAGITMFLIGIVIVLLAGVTSYHGIWATLIVAILVSVFLYEKFEALPLFLYTAIGSWMVLVFGSLSGTAWYGYDCFTADTSSCTEMWAYASLFLMVVGATMAVIAYWLSQPEPE